MERKLTVGTVCYDDFDGVFMTLQSIRMFHREALPDIEFLVIDNNPDGKHGEAVKALAASITQPIRYIPVHEVRGPAAAKNMVFTMAETEYVLCLDCHVMLWQGSLRRLIDFFRSGADGGNLLQGPLVMDDLQNFSTHFDLNVWSGGMWGQWATDERGRGIDMPPFEILAQGMGMFACRRSAWLGFNPRFKGFGGEEGVIHEKFRQYGRKTLCLPFLRWLHRFGRPNGVPYPLNFRDRVYNYMVGFHELNMDPTPIRDHFRHQFSDAEWVSICEEAVPMQRKWIEAVGNDSSPGPSVIQCLDPQPAQ